jgi:uncharacterized protein (UPF0332 family)
MSLKNEDRLAVVKYRIERADATLLEAVGVAESGWYNLSANRLYYAIYYAASALLISRGIPTKSHSGVKSLIHQHFVRTGILTLEEGSLIGMLFNLRQSGDYEDFKQVTKEHIEELTPKTILLVKKIKTLIKTGNDVTI